MLNRVSEHGRAVAQNAVLSGAACYGLSTAALSVLTDDYAAVGSASLVLGVVVGGINGLFLREDNQLESIKLNELSKKAYSIVKAGGFAAAGYIGVNFAAGVQTGNSREAVAAGAVIGVAAGVGSVIGDLNERSAIKNGWDSESDL